MAKTISRRIKNMARLRFRGAVIRCFRLSVVIGSPTAIRMATSVEETSGLGERRRNGIGARQPVIR